MRLPSPALVVALIALFIALGGTSYAVTQLPKNSVGTKQLKKSSVTSAKIKDGTIRTADLSKATRDALTGATGPRGEQGAAGAQSYGFRVGADAVVIENPSGATGVLDDFAITTPAAGYLLITLELTADSPNDVCRSTNNLGTLAVTINGTAINDLGAINLGAGRVLTAERTALVELPAGTHRVVMSLTCDPPDVVDAATRSYWTASGALYPAQLSASTSTG